MAATNTSFKLKDVEQLVNTKLDALTSVNWIAYLKHTERKEQKMWDSDGLMDDLMDRGQPVIISLGNDTSSEQDLSDNSESCESLV